MAKDERERTENLIENKLQRHFEESPTASSRQGSKRGSPYRENSESESLYSEDSHGGMPPSPENPKMTFEMIPLETHRAISRREFMNLYSEFYFSTAMFQKCGSGQCTYWCSPSQTFENRTSSSCSRTTSLWQLLLERHSRPLLP